MAGFKTIDSDFERSFTVGKIPSSNTACYREMIDETTESINVANFILSYFVEITPEAPVLSNHYPDQSTALNIEARPSTCKDYDSLNVQMLFSIFIAMVLFLPRFAHCSLDIILLYT